MQPNEIHAFPVALNLRDRHVLVLGGSEEAVSKVPKLLAAGAVVTIVAPALAKELSLLVESDALTWWAREFEESDVTDQHLVMLTEIDPARALQLRALADQQRFVLCTIDQPAFSDFFLVSSLVRGPIQVAISSSGKAPLLARRIRESLELALDDQFGAFARRFAALRAHVRLLPRAQRSEVLERALAGFAMDVRLRYPDEVGQGAGPPPDGAHDE